MMCALSLSLLPSLHFIVALENIIIIICSFIHLSKNLNLCYFFFIENSNSLFTLISFINCLEMIVILCSHILLAFAVWLITVLLFKKKHFVSSLAIRRQVNFSYNNNKIDEMHKKRKNKKGKRKQKRQEHLQLLSCQPQQQIKIQQSDHEQSQKQEKQQKNFIVVSQQKKPMAEENILNMNKVSFEVKQQLTKENSKEINSQIQKCVLAKKEQIKEFKQQSDKQNSKDSVFEEIQLIRNYFMSQLQQIVPYNRNYGHYKLCIQGSKKSLTIQWKYTPHYPKEPINIFINRQVLNPLELEILDKILKDNLEKLQTTNNYFYIFNLTTSIFQDLMISINQIPQDQKSQIQLRSQNEIIQSFDLKMLHSAPQDLKIKKEIYGKILDEIFYLHDMIEKPDVSTMKANQNEESFHLRQNNTRGRYQSQFQELEMIGQGGFGKVYKVRHKLDGNIYAIKKTVVNYADINDRKMLKEVQLLSKLNHPNIVRYYQSWLEDTHSMQELNKDMQFTQQQQSKIDQLNQIYAKWKEEKCIIKFKDSSQSQYQGSLVENSDIVFQYGEEDSGIVFEDQGEQMNVSEDNSSINHAEQQGRNQSQSSLIEGFRKFPFKILYIAMQLCSGINLRQFINKHFMEEEHKVQILRGILQGLAYMHSQKIIHRDLKPANIFLTDQKKVKIGDFGLATKQERSVSISLQQEQSDFLGDKTKAVGTGFYRAPQQLKSKKYDQKADIYSVGIIMLQLFFKFNTAMERTETLKELTNSYKLPKDFQREYAGTDLLENIQICLQQQPQKRPSASKLLQGFRNKYFTQLVSCIANPKHFQFSQLLNHLFAIKNQHVAILMRRDAYKPYQTQKIMKIYQIHRAIHFPTLPLISIQDYNILNGQKVKINRNGKYQLLTNRGLILQYSYNCLKSWLIYARDAMRKKKGLSMDEQREAIRRFTFEKIVNHETTNQKQIQFGQKMITAFDLAYKLQNGFNAFYFCEVLKISQSIVLTLNLTQKRPCIYISHSQIYSLLAKKYKVSTEILYHTLLTINQDQFYALNCSKRISYLEEKNLPHNFCKKISFALDETFNSGIELLEAMQVEKQSQVYQQIVYQIAQIQKVSKRVVNNQIRWKLGIPSSNCNGLFWQVGIVKGLTTVQEYAPGQQLCNYHIESSLDQQFEQPDVSLWCIGEYLEEQMQKMILQCWKNGLATKWYEWQVGQKQDKCRHNIILRRKNERVQVMIRHNELKKGQHREDRESSFISLQQFSMEVIKQMSVLNQISYH